MQKSLCLLLSLEVEYSLTPGDLEAMFAAATNVQSTAIVRLRTPSGMKVLMRWSSEDEVLVDLDAPMHRV